MFFIQLQTIQYNENKYALLKIKTNLFCFLKKGRQYFPRLSSAQPHPSSYTQLLWCMHTQDITIQSGLEFTISHSTKTNKQTISAITTSSQVHHVVTSSLFSIDKTPHCSDFNASLSFEIFFLPLSFLNRARAATTLSADKKSRDTNRVICSNFVLITPTIQKQAL